jgi:hypothetical protein
LTNKKTVKKLIYISTIGFAFIFLNAKAQSIVTPSVNENRVVNLLKTDSTITISEADEKGNFPKSAKEVLEGLQINGYYRFVTNLRNLKESYAHLENNKRNIFVGDDSQIPQLMLNITGQTSNRTSFGTDLYLWSPMTGNGQLENVKGLNLGVSLYGAFSTPVGNFNVRTGGINWLTLSPFTMQANKGYNRYSLFERNPWDPNTPKVDSRYADFYNAGAIAQDQRWGNQAFQGLIVEGAQMPHHFSFTGVYGKTQFDGGMSPIPNTTFGGRIKKEFVGNNDVIAFNTLNNTSYLDSVSDKTAGFNIGTLEITKYFNKLKLYAEIGAGRRFTNSMTTKYGEAISIKASTNVSKNLSLEVHAFRISPKVFNNSSVFMNSSIQQTTITNTQNQAVLIPVASAVLPMGSLSNNRQGIELSGQWNLGKFKNSIGYANSVELENLSSSLTYGHPFNSLGLAHFWRWDFPSNVGPYQNLNKVFRSVFETIQLKDLDTNGLPINKKYFNTVEINSKYKTKLAGKDFYVFYLGTFNSVQNMFAPMVNFTEKSLLRTYDHQIEMYWKLTPIIVWNNYASFERVIANYSTQTDLNTLRPKNQTGYSLATGADIQFSKSVGLYIRQRYMHYKDTSFRKDKYSGWETSIELKAFF